MQNGGRGRVQNGGRGRVQTNSRAGASLMVSLQQVIYDLLDPKPNRKGLDVREDSALGVHVKAWNEWP